MTKAELDALALITETVQTHQKCPDMQKNLDTEILESKILLEEAKCKIETDAVKLENIKSMCEQQLRRNADLEKEINVLKVKKELGESSDELQNARDLAERLASVETENKLQTNTIEALVNSNVSHTEEIKRLNQDNELLREDNDELKKTNGRLLDDVAALKKDNEDLKKTNQKLTDDFGKLMKDNEVVMKTNQQLADDFGKLKKENVETKEMLQNILQDFERVHRRLREIDTKMTSSG